MATASATKAAGSTQRRRSRGVPERRLAWFMVSPSLVLIALVAFYPIAYGVWVSLHQYSLLEAGLTRWAQPNPPFGNYTRALWGDGSTEFWDATRVTFIFTIISVALELVIGVAMAMAMHSAFKGQGILRTVVLVPWAILTVVTAITWQTIFEPELGFVNSLLGAVGLPNDTVWLGSEPEALGVMIFADVWKTAPFMALLTLAGLQTISGEIYEAAKVDGATSWQRFTKITLPLLRPAILVALIFRTLDALRIFDLPFVLTKGAQGTTTLSLLSYQEFAQNRLYGEGSALAILTFLIVMAVSFIYIRFVGGNLRGLAEE
jgi:multiple sugar transport system permease protein